jgi:hypothetical protein
VSHGFKDRKGGVKKEWERKVGVGLGAMRGHEVRMFETRARTGIDRVGWGLVRMTGLVERMASLFGAWMMRLNFRRIS